jgi:two-component system, sporulation sensor kinase E
MEHSMADKKQIAALEAEVARLQARVAELEGRPSLSASEQINYRLFFENANDLVMFHPFMETPESVVTFTDVNPATCRVLEYSREELLQLGPVDIISGDGLEDLPAEVTTLVLEQQLLFEKTLVSKSGRHIPVEIHAHLFELDGQTMVVSVARDISRWRTAWQASRRSEQWLRQVIDLIPYPVYAKDEDGRFLLVNQAGAAFGGLTVEEMTGHLESEWVHDDGMLEYLRAEDRQVLDSGQPFFVDESWLTNAAGQDVVLQTSKVPFETGLDGARGVLGISVDITGRIRSEMALRESKERFRQLVQHSVDGISMVDETGTIIEWNDGMARITAVPPAEAAGRKIWDLQFRLAMPHQKTDEAYDQLKSITTKMLATGQIARPRQPREREIMRVDGQVRVLQSRVFTISTGKGYRMGSISRDVTEQRQSEQALLEREQLFRETFESISDPAGLWERRPDGTIVLVRVNSAAREVSRQRISDLIGATVEDFFAHQPAMVAYFHHTFDTGEKRRVEMEYRLRTTGERKWTVADFTTVGDRYLLYVGRDVTDQRLLMSGWPSGWR